MKIPRKRKSNKKKNYGSSSIPKELANSKWWKLVYKVSEKEAQTIYHIL